MAERPVEGYGFYAPQKPQDEWTAELYEKHGLGGAPSMEEIEPVALELLEDPKTAYTAAELVFGRKLNATEDKDLLRPLGGIGHGVTSRTIYGLLLAMRGSI